MKAQISQDYDSSDEPNPTKKNHARSTFKKIPDAELVRFDQSFQTILCPVLRSPTTTTTHPAAVRKQNSCECSSSVGDPVALSNRILDYLPVMATMIDMQTHEILYANAYVKKLFGEVIGQTCWKALQKDQFSPCSFCTDRHLTNGKDTLLDSHQQRIKNTITDRYYEVTDSALRTGDGRLVKVSIAMAAITDQTEPIPSPEAFNTGFGNAEPHRIVVMCAHCNKIRDTAGQWLPPSKYLKQEMGTLVSHGMCSNCAKLFYPEFSGEEEKNHSGT